MNMLKNFRLKKKKLYFSIKNKLYMKKSEHVRVQILLTLASSSWGAISAENIVLKSTFSSLNELECFGNEKVEAPLT